MYIIPGTCTQAAEANERPERGRKGSRAAVQAVQLGWHFNRGESGKREDVYDPFLRCCAELLHMVISTILASEILGVCHAPLHQGGGN
jgi:hypothetical protein